MIEFKRVVVDDEELFLKTRDSFYKSAHNLLVESKHEYANFFKGYALSQLIVEQSRISYAKNFEIADLFYFDGSSEFHFYSQVYVSVKDKEQDKEFLCTYTLMLNENLEIVDDFLQ